MPTRTISPIRPTDTHMSTDQRPRIEVEATFLTFEQGGWRPVPSPGLHPGHYMPHLVVQPPDIRKCSPADDYLGVAFLEAPDWIIAGEPARCLLELMYHPGVNYDALQPGATFTIREGGKIVGFGIVQRWIAGDA